MAEKCCIEMPPPSNFHLAALQSARHIAGFSYRFQKFIAFCFEVFVISALYQIYYFFCVLYLLFFSF